MMIKNLLISMRPKQWVKNVFIFAPMIFSLHMFQLDFIKRSLLAFFLFSLITGAIYIFNDILDREKDRQHPQKKIRPIAAGRLSATSAGIFRDRPAGRRAACSPPASTVNFFIFRCSMRVSIFCIHCF